MFIVSKIIVTLFLSLFVLPNVQAAIDSTWLVNQQNPDGSFNAQKDIGYQMQNTSEVLRTLYAMGDIGLVDENLSLQKINASDSIHHYSYRAYCGAIHLQCF